METSAAGTASAVAALKQSELFKVIDGSGHVYRVFVDGRIEGFGEGCLIFNNYPTHSHYDLVRSCMASACPSLNKTDSGEGRPHSSGDHPDNNSANILTAAGEK